MLTSKELSLLEFFLNISDCLSHLIRLFPWKRHHAVERAQIRLLLWKPFNLPEWKAVLVSNTAYLVIGCANSWEAAENVEIKIHGDNKNQFKLFCIETYNTQEILSKEKASEFNSWPCPKETLSLLMADTFSSNHHSSDSRASYAASGQCL